VRTSRADGLSAGTEFRDVRTLGGAIPSHGRTAEVATVPGQGATRQTSLTGKCTRVTPVLLTCEYLRCDFRLLLESRSTAKMAEHGNTPEDFEWLVRMPLARGESKSTVGLAAGAKR
jgi:hypothetical protein